MLGSGLLRSLEAFEDGEPRSFSFGIETGSAYVAVYYFDE